MTAYASVNVQRGGTPAQGGSIVLSGIDVQIDNLSVEMGHYIVQGASGASPFDAYSVYIEWATSPTMIQRQDMLIDPATPDPLNNNQPTQYRVVGNPEYFSEDTHMELKAIRTYGK